jgi:hypothetical protein
MRVALIQPKHNDEDEGLWLQCVAAAEHPSLPIPRKR